MAMVLIAPKPGRRLIVPAGCLTLDGVPIRAGADLPREGAQVPTGIWATRAVGRGDAEPVAARAGAKPAAAPAPSVGGAK